MSLKYIQIYGMSSDANLNEFVKYSLFIETLFYSSLPEKLKLDGVQKVVVEFLDKTIYGEFNDQVIGSNKSTVVSLRKSFDYLLFLQLGPDDRKKKLAGELYTSLKKIANQLEWDDRPFHIAYDKMVKSNFVNTLLIGTIKTSKNKKNKAGVFINSGLDVGVVSVVFFDQNLLETKKVDLFEILPHPIVYQQLIGKSKWISDSEFEVGNNSEEFHVKISLENFQPFPHFTPKGREISGVLEELKFLLKDRIPPWLFYRN